MKARNCAIMLMLVFTLFSTTAQYLYKIGAAQLEVSVAGILANWPLILGLGFYAVAAAIMITALKQGELSVLYPFIALSYVWVALVADFFLGEAMHLVNWAGILLVVAGVSLTGYGAEHG